MPDCAIFATQEASSAFVAAVTSEIKRITHEVKENSSKLERQLTEALYTKQTLKSLESNLNVAHFPGQFRRELYIRATNWNAQLSLLGQLLTSLVGATHNCSTLPGESASAIARSDLIATEMLRLHQIKQALHKATSPTDTREMLDDDELEEGVTDDNYERTQFQEHFRSNADNPSQISNKMSIIRSVNSESVPHRPKLNVHELGDLEASGACDQSSVMTGTLLDFMPSVPKPPPLQDHSTHQMAAEGVGRRERFGPARRTYKLSSAFARFMGKECPEEDPWTVRLGELEGGRPCLDLGSRGEVLLVHEGQPTTIIAYSLNTVEYTRALRRYLDNDLRSSSASSFVSNRAAYSDSGPSSTITPTCPTSNNVANADNAAGINTSLHATQSPEAVDSTYLPWAGGLASLIASNDANTLHYHDSVHSRNMSSNPETSKFMHIANPMKLTSPAAAVDFSEMHEWPHQKCELPPGYLEKQLLSQQKTHIKHRFADIDANGNTLCKFVCQAYWATQFAAVRQAYIGLGEDEEIGYLRSLSIARPWNAQGGKSGATFFKTADARFVVKQITRTELQMFLEYAPAYFEYLSKSFFHKYDTLLVKVLGVYQIGSHNRVNGRRMMEQVVVMENLFHERTISRAFDLKGSTRSRYARVSGSTENVIPAAKNGDIKQTPTLPCKVHPVLLDENFMEFTSGRPLPLRDQAKAYFNSAVLNDTLFLSLINVVDYSILVGMDEENHVLVVGIIDYMRQYDIIKKMERMGKSVGMIAGQAEPTVIQPPNYRNRFQAAMERYFMMVPDKWTSFRMQR